ncbi:BEN domain-containing protein 5-like isoform X2 [Ornithodoros turicata]|uniref:BEN domain-containing protein 5-like isoform X2 n=1 Tax=Ornithodoros turicata TaxID=34597 RepID=UPI0031386E90
MFAHVRYTDKVEAVLPVSLIQNFKPKHVEDFDASLKRTFWQGHDEPVGGYYTAQVLRLGETKEDIIAYLIQSGQCVPAIIEGPYVPSSETVSKKQTGNVSSKNKKKANAEARRHELKEILRERSTNASDLEDKVRKLKEKVHLLEAELLEERQLCRSVQKELIRAYSSCSCHKMTCSQQQPQSQQPTATVTTAANTFLQLPAGTTEATLVDDHPVFTLDDVVVCPPLQYSDDVGHSSTTAEVTQASSSDLEPSSVWCSLNQMVLPASTSEEEHSNNGGQLSGTCSTPTGIAPLPQMPMRTEDSDVVLGSGIKIKNERYQWLMRVKCDSKFCKDMARTVWSLEELMCRSVTGAACRRKKDAEANRALTPKKLAAVKSMPSCFIHFIALQLYIIIHCSLFSPQISMLNSNTLQCAVAVHWEVFSSCSNAGCLTDCLFTSSPSLHLLHCLGRWAYRRYIKLHPSEQAAKERSQLANKYIGQMLGDMMRKKK